jgi:hypothetical protein
LRPVQRCQCLSRRTRHDDVGAAVKIEPRHLACRGHVQLLPLLQPADCGDDRSPQYDTHTLLLARRVPIVHDKGTEEGTVPASDGWRAGAAHASSYGAFGGIAGDVTTTSVAAMSRHRAIARLRQERTRYGSRGTWPPLGRTHPFALWTWAFGFGLRNECREA